MRNTVSILRAGIEEGDYLGAQTYVSVDREPLLDAGFGMADLIHPMCSTTVVPWFCNSKPILALVALALGGEGVLALDATIDRYLSGWNSRYGTPTVLDLLRHTAGVSRDLDDLGVAIAMIAQNSRESVVERVSQAGVEYGWVPGERACYSTFSGWLLLDAVVRSAACADPDDLARTIVIEPLRMTSSVSRVRPLSWAEPGALASVFFAGSSGREPREIEFLNDPELSALSVPGCSFRGPMAELALVYEAALFDRSIGRRLPPNVLRDWTRVWRTGISDEALGVQQTHDWGLGVIVDPAAFGTRSGPGTFGHTGLGTSVVFADPSAGLVIALFFNGVLVRQKSFERRNRAVIDAIYSDLEL